MQFSPNLNLSFIFKSAIFHLPAYKHVFVMKIDKKWSPLLFCWATRSHFHFYYINKISNYQETVASKLQWIPLLISLSRDSIYVICVMWIRQKYGKDGKVEAWIDMCDCVCDLRKWQNGSIQFVAIGVNLMVDPVVTLWFEYRNPLIRVSRQAFQEK